jgi:hypothetical protein
VGSALKSDSPLKVGARRGRLSRFGPSTGGVARGVREASPPPRVLYLS